MFVGVTDVKADPASNKLTVTGKVDPNVIKTKLEQKTKKKIEIVSSQPKKDGGGDKKADGKVEKKDEKTEKKAEEKSDKKPDQKAEKKPEEKAEKKPEEKKTDDKKPKEVTLEIFNMNHHVSHALLLFISILKLYRVGFN